METLQVAIELEWMTDLYRGLAPARILEIGCWEGGTLRVWLEEATPEFALAVDLEHRNRIAYAEWCKPETTLVAITASSESVEAIAAIRQYAPYDWVFIDGDHDEKAVRSDVEVTLPLVRPGGILAMHDVAQGPLNKERTGPEIVLADLAGRGMTTGVFVDSGSTRKWAHGVGVVYL